MTDWTTGCGVRALGFVALLFAGCGEVVLEGTHAGPGGGNPSGPGGLGGTTSTTEPAGGGGMGGIAGAAGSAAGGVGGVAGGAGSAAGGAGGTGGVAGAGGSAAGGAGGTGAGSSTGSGGMGGSSTASGPCFCASDQDCPLLAIECKESACVDCLCQMVNLPAGTPAMTQTAGDCWVNLCSAGLPVATVDDTDVPADGNDCTIETCDAGVPSSAPSPPGSLCASAGGAVCNGNGACVDCLDNSDCALLEQCVLQQCVAGPCGNGVQNGDETDVDCGGATCPGCAVGQACGMSDSSCTGAAYCKAGLCTPKGSPGASCVAGNACLSGFCADGVCCQAACVGTCKSCSMAKTGQPSGTCANITFGTDPDNECAGALTCNGSGACN